MIHGLPTGAAWVGGVQERVRLDERLYRVSDDEMEESGSSWMTARRSKFARSGGAPLLGRVGLRARARARALPAGEPRRHRPDLVGKLSFHETSAEERWSISRPSSAWATVELLAANPGVDPWLPGETQLTVPAARLLPSGKREASS